jgi:hypothetical protein
MNRSDEYLDGVIGSINDAAVPEIRLALRDHQSLLLSVREDFTRCVDESPGTTTACRAWLPAATNTADLSRPR